jgi:hypothetical protein
MEISGKIIIALPEVSGTSKAGNAWKKREYVLETQETYPRKVFFNFFGEKVDQYPLNVGDEVTVSFDIDSREFNGRWYTDIRAWKAEKGGAAAGAPAPQPGFGAAPAAPATNIPGDFPPAPADLAPAGASDDLPF